MMDADLVRTLFDCAPNDGLLIWRPRPLQSFSDGARFNAERNWRVWNTRYAGKIAGCYRKDGYRVVRFDGQMHLYHRLIWLWTCKSWPRKFLDHINGDPSDNRLCNLREATHQENCQNRGLDPRSTTGLPGVSWDCVRSDWQANIRANGKQHNLGRFKTKEEAAAAYREAKRRLHPFAPEVRQ